MLPAVVRGHAGPHGGVDQPPEPPEVSPFTVVAGQLSNPRDILIEHHDTGEDTVYVVEAGSGGESPCADSLNGDYHDCYGNTGAIVRISGGVVDRYITGLPSIAGPNGGFGVGASHIVRRGRSLYLTIANYGDAERRAIFAQADPRFGKVLQINNIARERTIADLSAFEDQHNPDGDPHHDSNPTGLALGQGRRMSKGNQLSESISPSGAEYARVFYATDSGGNDLLGFHADGRVFLRYVFPARDLPAPASLCMPSGSVLRVQAVPTTVLRGPDRAIYVAEFTGFPYPKGAARVLRFDDDAQEPTIHAGGFTNIIDMAFGPDGSLYVLEMATNGLISGDVTGAVTKIAPDGARVVLAKEGLAYPTAIAVDRQGRVYVANYGVSGRKAQLIRF